MTDRTLRIVVTDADLAYAHRQDRYACALVRAIQRDLPEATRVTVDAKEIRFSVENKDGSGGTRWTFETPREMVKRIIRPFDTGEDLTAIPLSQRTFTLDHAQSSQPMIKATPAQKTARRHNHSPSMRTGRASRNRSANANVRTANRFVDDLQLAAEMGSGHDDR